MHLDSSGDFAVQDPNVPEAAVGYRTNFLRDMFSSSVSG